MADLSVVIPTHGREVSLDRLLTSLVADEVGASAEVIVVVDGLDQSTYEGVAERWPMVTWLWQEHAGPAVARNRGWHRARADAVLFVDDDCVMTHGCLASMVEALQDSDAVGARIEPLRPGRVIADFMHAEHLVSHKVERGEVRWFVTACLMVRRSVLDAVDGFDESFVHGGEDVDLTLRMAECGYRLAVCDDAVVLHDHRASLWQLVRTYYRHGTGQRLLARRHPSRRVDLHRSTSSRLRPSSWSAVYREYRRSSSVARSTVFILLRATMMLPWLVGALVGTSPRTGR